MQDWRIFQGKVLKAFVLPLNKRSNSYILKGGTSLMLCYGLTRFSEDISLDAYHIIKGIEDIVNAFCQANSFTYRVAKDTNTVKRYMIYYGSNKPLKVEISYRRKNIDSSEFTIVNGILVYTISSILTFKLNAYNQRDKIRDLYDVVFICKNYWSCIPKTLQLQLVDSLSYKGLEHFDYLISTQQDELIDSVVLGNEFLDLYNKLGLNNCNIKLTNFYKNL